MTNTTQSVSKLDRKIVSDCSKELGVCWDILQAIQTRLHAAGSSILDTEVSVALQCLTLYATSNQSVPQRHSPDIDLSLQLAGNAI